MRKILLTVMPFAMLGACELETSVLFDEKPREVSYLDERRADAGKGEGGTGGLPPLIVDNRSYRLEEVGELGLRAPILQGSAVEKEVGALGECLARQWDLPRRPLKFVIMSGIEPTAEALPDEVAVNIGLLIDHGDSPGTIAFTLAHEISHALLFHYDREEFRDAQQKVLNFAASTAVMASVLSETRVQQIADNRWEFKLEDVGNVRNTIQNAFLTYSSVYVIGEGLLESAWSRQQEYNADRLGADLFTGAGFQKHHIFQAFTQFQSEEGERKLLIEQYLEMKPNELAEAFLRLDVGYMMKAGRNLLKESLEAVLGDVWGEVNASHPSAAQRKEGMTKYLNSIAHLAKPAVATPCNFDRLAASLKTTEFTRAAKAVTDLQAVTGYLRDNKIDQARKTYSQLLRGKYKRHPVFRYFAYLTESRAGRTEEAIAQLRAIDFDATTPLIAFTSLASEFIAGNDVQRATDIIRMGQRYFPADYFYAALLQLSYQQNNLPQREAIKLQCNGSSFKQVVIACAGIVSNREKVEDGLDALIDHALRVIF